MKEGSIVDSGKNMIEGQFAEVTDISQAKKGYNVLYVSGNINIYSDPFEIEILEENLPALILSVCIPVNEYTISLNIKNSTSYTLRLSYAKYSQFASFESTTVNSGAELTVTAVSTYSGGGIGGSAPDIIFGSPVVVEIEE